MVKHSYRSLLIAIALVALGGCGQASTQDLVDDYLAFYYPTSGQFYYIVNFEWGSYTIDTFPKAEEQVHPDSAPYKGFITLRPSAETDAQNKPLHIFLVTAAGDVWMRAPDGSIPASSTRQEVVKEETENGVSTVTSTIVSAGEPVIDDYLENPDNWQPYGRLVASGDGYRLQRLAN